MKLHQLKFRSDIRKWFFTEGGWSLEQALQGSDHGTKPVRVQGASG